MSGPNDLIQQLATQDAQQQNADLQKAELQVQQTQILRAKLPLFFKDLRAQVEAKAREYDDVVHASQGKSETTVCDAGLGFKVEHKGAAKAAYILAFFNVTEERISFGGAGGSLNNPTQNTLTSGEFDATVNGSDLLVCRKVLAGTSAPLSPQQIADEIMRVLVS